MNYKEIFEEIYKRGVWNDNRSDVPLSGPGSSLKYAHNALILLDDFVVKNNVKSIIDLGCGDLTWVRMANFFHNEDIYYCGIDIVESVIESHKESFPIDKFPNKKFISKNILEYVIEEVDLIILRDILFHLKNEDIINVFENIKNQFKYIAITSNLNDHNDDTLNEWFYAERNIHREPFNIGKNHVDCTYEKDFDRNFYIYLHHDFYQWKSCGIKSTLKSFLLWLKTNRLMA